MARSKRQARGETEDDGLYGNLVTVSEPAGVASEAYRTLRTNLLYATVDTPPEVVLVTSPGPAEGKSTTCANLGVVLAQAGKDTLIMDCDLRKPAMHRIFGLRNFHGVVNALVGEYGLLEVCQEPMPGLKVATAGPLPPSPAELLSSRRFSELIDRIRPVFDYVLIDAPPVEPVSDPAILATQADGVLLVLDAQNTRKGALRQGMQSLEAVGANVLGIVMNNFGASGGNSRYGGYTYQ